MKILITGDVNDGDYVTEVTEITQEELNLITPIIEAIKVYPSRSNWASRWVRKLEDMYPQFFTQEDDFDPEYSNGFEPNEAMSYFMDLLPNDDQGGVNSIRKIEIIQESKILLNCP